METGLFDIQADHLSAFRRSPKISQPPERFDYAVFGRTAEGPLGSQFGFLRCRERNGSRVKLGADAPEPPVRPNALLLASC